MITKRTGNGQTECIRCKEKGKFALYWDSFLYTYNKKPYCLDCLFEILEEKDKVIDEIYNYCKSNISECENEQSDDEWECCIEELKGVLEILEKDKEVK